MLHLESSFHRSEHRLPVHLHMCTHTYTHFYTHVHTLHTYIHTHTAYNCIYTYTRLYTYSHISHTHIHIVHTHILHTRTFTHTHTYWECMGASLSLSFRKSEHTFCKAAKMSPVQDTFVTSRCEVSGTSVGLGQSASAMRVEGGVAHPLPRCHHPASVTNAG